MRFSGGVTEKCTVHSVSTTNTSVGVGYECEEKKNEESDAGSQEKKVHNEQRIIMHTPL